MLTIIRRSELRRLRQQLADLESEITQPQRVDEIPYAIGSILLPGTSKAIEEMGELLQVLGKFMGTGGLPNHWDGTNLDERLREEMADLYAALDFLRRHNVNPGQDGLALMGRRLDKATLFEQWHEEQSRVDPA